MWKKIRYKRAGRSACLKCEIGDYCETRKEGCNWMVKKLTKRVITINDDECLYYVELKKLKERRF